MSENRFILCNKTTDSKVWDTLKKQCYSLEYVVFLLNKQESTIIKQDEEIKKLKRTERSWRRIHCCNKESDNCGIIIEQQATIKRLEEENEQLKKELKGLNRRYIAFSEATDKRLREMTTIPYSKKVGELEKEIHRWKTLYEIKDKEVTARVKRLNEICNQYKYAITFDKDIDPNDAVNILCDRILQTEVDF